MFNMGRYMVLYLTISLLIVLHPFQQTNVFEKSVTGPYLGGINFQVGGKGNESAALIGNETDLIGYFLDSQEITFLSDYPIEAPLTPINGYSYLTLNCQKYPLNITALRRALAFSFDKELICEEGMQSTAFPLDSCVPKYNPWSCEGMFNFCYYEPNYPQGNTLLDSAGFKDIDGDGIREAPNGSNFSLQIAASAYSTTARFICNHTLNCLRELGIDGEIILDDGSYELGSRLYFHGDYDIALWGSSYTDSAVDWLRYYSSKYIDQDFRNFPNFHNASFDSWIDKLVNSISPENVYEAAREMQKIIAYECPIIVCCQGWKKSAYRTDRFQGFVNAQFKGAPCWFSYLSIHRKQSQAAPFSSILRTTITQDLPSFNIMILGDSAVYGQFRDTSYSILRLLYDSLLMQAPNGSICSWLADSFEISAHSEAPSIPENTTRITFFLNESARWSDGSRLTANDVAYCFEFYKASANSNFGTRLSSLIASYVDSEGRVVLEFEGTSYWHLWSIVDVPILPLSRIDLDPNQWLQWDPNPNSEDMLCSGPYVPAAHEPESFVFLEPNPYYYRISNISNTVTTRFPWIQIVSLIVAVFAVGVTLSVFELQRRRSTKSN